MIKVDKNSIGHLGDQYVLHWREYNHPESPTVQFSGCNSHQQSVANARSGRGKEMQGRAAQRDKEMQG